MKLQQFFTGIPQEILSNIENLEFRADSKRCHQEIDQLLSKTVLLGGKRLRPLLTFLFGHYFDQSIQDIRPLARAIEMVHAASLAHDDVIDEASMRRGKPSINAESSNKRAVLAGDYLLAEVIVDLTQNCRPELVKEMALVIQQLSVGEWLQLDACEDRDYTQEVIKKIALYKTSSVMSWCSLAPAYLAGFDRSVIELCRSFGEHLGLAFQMIDDTLDFSRQSDKDQFLDLDNGIVNSVVFCWFENDSDIYCRFKKGESLRSFLEKEYPESLKNAISQIQSEAIAHIESCHQILDAIEGQAQGRIDKTKLKSGRKSLNFVLDYLGKRVS